jgi:hypothetical protein
MTFVKITAPDEPREYWMDVPHQETNPLELHMYLIKQYRIYIQGVGGFKPHYELLYQDNHKVEVVDTMSKNPCVAQDKLWEIQRRHESKENTRKIAWVIKSLNSKIQYHKNKPVSPPKPEPKDPNSWNKSEKAKAHLNKRVQCSCGGHYTHKNKKAHEQSEKHQKWLQA